ncbi:MAG TPA: HAMP domain-containing protein, partial [Nitrosomonas nitrosa]|nr:HAMP domain-containing protein [Nitrosomonas nitrosa]
MFSKLTNKFRRSLALRLTAWYAAIFFVFSIIAFIFTYFLVAAALQEKTDEDLEEDMGEFIAFMHAGGIERVKNEMILETQGREAEQTFFRLWTANGELLATSDLTEWSGLTEPIEILAQLRSVNEPILLTIKLPHREYDVRSIYATIGPDVVLQMGESLEDNVDFMGTLLKGFLMMCAVVLLLGGPIGWFMAKRALRGVQEITSAATAITGNALEKRVSVQSRGDELDNLAHAFNAMLDRIQALIIGMREMTDNLAHDLRSPVGRIRAAAEMALTNGGSKPGVETIAATTAEECDRLLEMINTTLDIAEAESGAAKLKIVDIDAVELVNDAVELFQPVAEDKEIILFADLPKQSRVQGDLQRLQRAIACLLDNALKYTATGGRIALRLSNEHKQIKLAIKDTG